MIFSLKRWDMIFSLKRWDSKVRATNDHNWKVLKQASSLFWQNFPFVYEFLLKLILQDVSPDPCITTIDNDLNMVYWVLDKWKSIIFLSVLKYF